MSEPRSRVAGAVVGVAVDAVVTHHLDGFRSGVARFNELLAAHLGVAFLGLEELRAARPQLPLLSFKVAELDAPAAAALTAWLDDATGWDVFLHEYRDLPLERRLVEGARRVLCGNHMIEAEVAELATSTRTLWTPGLMLDRRTFAATELSVFSFGMAHKLRTDMFLRLKALLEATCLSYALYVSAANHETASLKDSEAVFAAMHEIFPDALYFLGNLSDVAVLDRLAASTYFAAFFEPGVRANNTSVASAMERGAVVVTNLDRWSPPDLVHMDNVVDIEQCDRLPVDGDVLAQLGERAAETAGTRTWERLVAEIRA